MLTAMKPLQALTAADLMSPEVVTIPQAMSLKGAAHRLAQAGISGAPVVDSDGRCVGVLSASDFVAWAEKGEHAVRQRPAEPCCVHSSWQVLTPETLPADEVGCYMTADPVLVSPAATIVELARMMVDAGIHRVIVVDELERPIGVVSSTDLVAAMAYNGGTRQGASPACQGTDSDA